MKQPKGCGRVLDDASSKLFGLYPWCEIGLTYFSVSLVTLLVAPEYTRWLAAFAVCCLAACELNKDLPRREIQP